MCAPAGVVATVRDAVAAGVTAVQLRDPAAADADLVALGREIRTVLAGTGVPLVVNDRVDLVAAIGADGAHVGQSDTDVAAARAICGPAAFLGLSVQVGAQVTIALDAGLHALDYLGVGPVWGTATKPDHAPPGGIDRLRRIVALSPWPCVAIGGITAARIRQLRGTGVAGVAVVSAICGQPDVSAATATLRRLWDANPA